VFLDEIGEVDGAIQVKLLRVLQSRTFQRLGETQDRRFQGKVVAATNRDLAAEIAAGRFREDFYYRLCSGVVVTPSLAAQLGVEELREHRAERLREDVDPLDRDVPRAAPRLQSQVMPPFELAPHRRAVPLDVPDG